MKTFSTRADIRRYCADIFDSYDASAYGADVTYDELLDCAVDAIRNHSDFSYDVPFDVDQIDFDGAFENAHCRCGCSCNGEFD